MIDSIHTLADLQALDGKLFDVLTDQELAVFDFYAARGRKYDVSIVVGNEEDPKYVMDAPSKAIVRVTLGTNAESIQFAKAH